MNERPDKITYYLKIAKDVALRSPCVSRRRFGAILVKDDSIISTGYAGTIRGAINCGIDCECLKDLYSEERYKSYEHCCSIHAEQNAIINAARAGVSTIGATMYVAEVNDDCERPCHLCRRFIVQAGIKNVIEFNAKVGKITNEDVSTYVQMESDWITEQLKNAPKKK